MENPGTSFTSYIVTMVSRVSRIHCHHGVKDTHHFLVKSESAALAHAQGCGWLSLL